MALAAGEIQDKLQDLAHDFQIPSWKGSCLFQQCCRLMNQEGQGDQAASIC